MANRCTVPQAQIGEQMHVPPCTNPTAARYGLVRSKMKPAFVTKVLNQPSTKRDDQDYTVVATDHIDPEFLEFVNRGVVVATEKMDGCCAKVDMFGDIPALFLRLDRRRTPKGKLKLQQVTDIDQSVDRHLYVSLPCCFTERKACDLH
jgi:hypothetical protein